MKLQKLQAALQAKAKASPKQQFHALKTVPWTHPDTSDREIDPPLARGCRP